jgi:hypothetical protein
LLKPESPQQVKILPEMFFFVKVFDGGDSPRRKTKKEKHHHSLYTNKASP